MSQPGFTAEASLRPARGRYRGGPRRSRPTGLVIPQDAHVYHLGTICEGTTLLDCYLQTDDNVPPADWPLTCGTVGSCRRLMSQ
jgi:hypothetical protein